MIFSVSFSPDGKRLASGGMHGIVLQWDLQSGKQLRTHQFLNGWFQSVAFAPDGRNLAAGSSSGRIQVWDVLTGEEQFVFEEHGAGLSRIALSPDGATIVTASADQTVRLWNLNTARPSAILRAFGAAVYTVDFAADGKRLAISGDDGSVRLLSAITAKEEGHLDLPGKNACRRAVYSPSGRLLATGGIQDIRLWDAVTGNQIRQLKGHDGIVGAFAFSPDERLLASLAHSFGDQNGQHQDWTVRIWDVASGRQLHRFEQLYAWEPAFRPDGRVLVYLAGNERRMRCRDVITGKERSGVPDTDLTAYVFSPEGQWLATAHVGGTIRVRERATGQEVLHFQAAPSGASQLIWAPDGRKMFSNNGDATVLIWDLTPPHSDPDHRQKAFQPEQLERAWLDLKAQDAKQAYRAVWLLTAAGDDAITLLRRRLQSATDIGNIERIRSLVTDLGHQQFARREVASRQLAEFGAAAEPALVRALANQPSAEVRSRVETLLNQLADHEKQPTLDELQHDRALAVVERIGSAAARQVLEDLTKGAPETVMGQKAEAALRRLTRRLAVAP
jgi:WD40 repeat protein